MITGLWTLDARLLEPLWEGWFLTNDRPNPDAARVWTPSGMGFAGSYIGVLDPTANFPYGLAVEPP